ADLHLRRAVQRKERAGELFQARDESGVHAVADHVEEAALSAGRVERLRNAKAVPVAADEWVDVNDGYFGELCGATIHHGPLYLAEGLPHEHHAEALVTA